MAQMLGIIYTYVSGGKQDGSWEKAVHLYLPTSLFTFLSIWRGMLDTRVPTLIYTTALESFPLNVERVGFDLFLFESKKSSGQLEDDLQQSFEQNGSGDFQN